MKTIKPLASLSSEPATNKAFVDALVNHIEVQIQSMGALKGIVIKKTYAALKAVKPGYVRHIVEVLSNDYIKEFTPMHDDYRQSQVLPSDSIKPFLQHLKAHQKEADAIFWKILDSYAAKRSDSFIGKAYKTSRSTIESHLPLIFELVCTEIDKQTIVAANEEA